MTNPAFSVTDIIARREARRQELHDSIPQMEWDSFVADCFRWQQGEHIGIIGPTNSGKTVLMLALLPMRKYVVAVGTKPRDKSLWNLVKYHHYKLLEEWKPFKPDSPKRVLWPDASGVDAEIKQRPIIGRALMAIFREGKWCVAIDELWYVIHVLKLEKLIKVYLLQARSLQISLLLATQRPAFVPLEVYDQSTHLFFFRDNDERNLKRISGISWRSAAQIQTVVANLNQHEVLYVNTRDGLLIRTMAPPPEGR